MLSEALREKIHCEVDSFICERLFGGLSPLFTLRTEKSKNIAESDKNERARRAL